MSFFITTERERTEALGEITEWWMDPSSFEPLLEKTSWLEYNSDKRNSYSRYQKMIRGARQALPLTNERKILYIYAMDNIQQCRDLFIPFISAFFHPLEVRMIEWTDHNI